MPVLISVMARCCAVASLSSTMPVTLPASSRRMRPYPAGSATVSVRMAMPASAADSKFRRVAACTSGTSPYSTRVVLRSAPSCSCGMACATAWPVPCCGDWVTKIRSGWSLNAACTSRAPCPTTMTMRSGSSWRAVSTTWPSMGLPATGCNTLGKPDCIRLPMPAARITTFNIDQSPSRLLRARPGRFFRGSLAGPLRPRLGSRFGCRLAGCGFLCRRFPGSGLFGRCLFRCCLFRRRLLGGGFFAGLFRRLACRPHYAFCGFLHGLCRGAGRIHRLLLCFGGSVLHGTRTLQRGGRRTGQIVELGLQHVPPRLDGGISRARRVSGCRRCRGRRCSIGCLALVRRSGAGSLFAGPVTEQAAGIAGWRGAWTARNAQRHIQWRLAVRGTGTPGRRDKSLQCGQCRTLGFQSLYGAGKQGKIHAQPVFDGTQVRDATIQFFRRRAGGKHSAIESACLSQVFPCLAHHFHTSEHGVACHVTRLSEAEQYEGVGILCHHERAPVVGQATYDVLAYTMALHTVHKSQFRFAGKFARPDHAPQLVAGQQAKLTDFAIFAVWLDTFVKHAITDQHVFDLIAFGKTAMHAQNRTQRA